MVLMLPSLLCLAVFDGQLLPLFHVLHESFFPPSFTSDSHRSCFDNSIGLAALQINSFVMLHPSPEHGAHLHRCVLLGGPQAASSSWETGNKTAAFLLLFFLSLKMFAGPLQAIYLRQANTREFAV